MSAIPSEIAALLMPISLENPAGLNLEYEQIYEDIRQARESDPDYLPHDEWTIAEPRRADWQKVRTLCVEVLSNQSKDLQITCWFVESLTHLQGIEGTEIGFHFLREFITKFWSYCWPALDEEGAATFRYSKLSRLDRDISQALYIHPLINSPKSTLAYWHKVLAFEHKVCTWPESRETLIAEEGDLTIATFNAAVSAFSSIEISQQAKCLERLQKQLDSLEDCYFSLNKEEPHILFAQTRQTLADIVNFLLRLSQQVIPSETESISLSFSNTNLSSPTLDTTELYQMQDRNEPLTREIAISQMLSIAHFFRQSEPSSPVPFLMERAIRWANMSITEWLEEMLTDSDSLLEINNVLKGKRE